MKRIVRTAICFGISLLLIGTSALAVFAQATPVQYVSDDETFAMDSDLQAEWYDLKSGEMIVTFEQNVDAAEAEGIISDYGFAVKEPFNSLDLGGLSFIVTFNKGDSLVRSTMVLFIDERIKYATPNAPVMCMEPSPQEKYTTPVDFSYLTPGEDYAEGEVLVTLDRSVPDIPFACRLMEKYGCVVTSINGFSNNWDAGKVITARIMNSKTVPEALIEIQMDPFVSAASPNLIWHAFDNNTGSEPEEPDTGEQEEPETGEYEYKDDYDWDKLISGKDYEDNTLLVTFDRNLPEEEDMYRIAEEYECFVTEVLGFSDAWDAGKVAKVRIPDNSDLSSIIGALESNSDIVNVIPNLIIYLNSTDEEEEDEIDYYATMPSNADLWYMNRINIQDAWEIATCDNDVTVAVLDSGIDLTHPDLAANILTQYAYDAVGLCALTQDYDTNHGHGTHVAGIISAIPGNNIGIDGVSHNANIIPVRVLANGQDMYMGHLYNGLYYLKNTVNCDSLKVINLSLGGLNYQDFAAYPIESTINALSADGIITVCAAGNNGRIENLATMPTYPSDFDACVSVIATNRDNEKATFSSYNLQKDISAPGVGIYSTALGGYIKMSGTSMAAPMVSGIIALMFAANPDLTNDQVKDLLYSTAVDLGTPNKDAVFGWGLVNAAEAVIGAKEGHWKRLDGSNRYITMQSVSSEGWENGSCNAVVLARGDDFPDALSATGLAGILDCPMLLTKQNELPTSTSSEITRLGASTVYIVGGNGVITDYVKNLVQALPGVENVIRLYGSNRYATCYDIYEEKIGEWSGTLIIGTGVTYYDILSISPYAFANKSPVFLVNVEGNLTDAMKAAINGGAFNKAIIIGSSALVSQQTETLLNAKLGASNVMRIWGSNRYETSSLIADWESGEYTNADFQPSVILDYAHCTLVNGVAIPNTDPFADALPGGALAGHLGSVMLLTKNDTSSAGNYTLTHNISPHIMDVVLGYINGGTGTLSVSFETYLENLRIID